MRSVRVAFFLLAFVVAAVGPVLLAQTVTLDMHDVTIKEVTDELAAQTGYRFQYMGVGGADEWPATIPEIRAKDRPLKEVLREACESAGYYFERMGDGAFYLRAGAFRESPHLVVVEGYRISVDRVDVYKGGRSIDFVNQPGQTNHASPSLNLTFGLDAPSEQDGMRILGFAEVSICDDRDRVSLIDEMRAQSRLREHFRLNPGPDRGQVSVQFDDAPLDAQSLKYVSGALIVAESLDSLEFRFDDPQEGAAKQTEGFRVKIARLNVEPGHLDLSLTMSTPEGMDWQARQAWRNSQLDVLFDDGGLQRLSLGSAWGSPGFGIGWGEGERRPVAITYRALKPSEQEHLLPFRIENIPLPE